MAQVLGITDIVWRGQAYAVKEGSKVKLGGTVNKAVVTGRRVDRAEAYEASEISATFALRRGMSLLTIWAPGDGALEVICDTGQTFSWSTAFLTNRPEFTSGEGGDVEATWSANDPNEVV